MKIKLLLIFLIGLNFSLNAQQGSIYETYKQPNYQGDTNASTIFPKAFQEYNYIKTSRGIEVYRTYKHTNVYTSSTNRYYQSGSTIFSVSEPEFILKNDGSVYRTYKYGTNKSSIFSKPFQDKIITSGDRSKLSFDGETLSGSE